MNARQIIEKFGGQSALAAHLGKGQSTVAYWAKTGSIPGRWHADLLTVASRLGIALAASDLISTGVDSISALGQTPYEQEATADESSEATSDATPFLFYASDTGAVKVRVQLVDETVWASQKGMSEIFNVEVPTISYHLKEIFESGELAEEAVIRNFLITAFDGKSYDTKYYSLDAIISVGYRVNSFQATQFRKWATTVLKGYLIKGFALDDERLKQGKTLFGKDYFDELLEKIREIRASERRFYQKITDIYSQCSIDYDKNSPISQQFYAHVQDKLHFAIHGMTSAELIGQRADASKPHMGLQTWKNGAKGGKITKLDVVVGKNYLNADEMGELNRLVSMYLDFAENFARRRKTMTMQQWSDRLDGFLEFNAYDVLEKFGKVKRENAEKHAHAEFEKFRVTQDAAYRSDFDEVVDQIKSRHQLPPS